MTKKCIKVVMTIRTLACTAALVLGTTAAVAQQDAALSDVATAPEAAPSAASEPTATAESSKAATEVVDTIPVAAPTEAAEPPPTRTSSSRLVEEIVVTAQKREENLQDVPISVTAFSAQTLDAKGVLTAQDLPLVTPGLTLSTSVNFLTVFIRGVGSDAYLVADPSVASYVDGIYFPFSNGAIQDFGAIERIEVLKGPQGTLFGRNAVGGAINVITKDPSLTDIEGAFQTVYGDYNTTATRVHGSVPLIEDHLALSASLVYNEGDNYIDGSSAGKSLQKDRTKGGRLKLRWSPADWMDGTLALVRIKQQGAGSDYAPNGQVSPLGQALGVQRQDAYAGAVNEDIFFFHDNTTVYGQLNFFPGPVDVKLIGSHQDLESLSNYDFDGSPSPLVFFQIEPGAAKVKTGELQILSNDTTWGADRFSWIVGGYYFDSVAGFPKAFSRVATTDLATGQLFGVQLPAELADAVSDALAGSPIPTGTVDFVGLLDTESYSYFAQGTFKFTDWVSLTLGGRYQSDQRFVIQSSAGTRNADGSSTDYQSYSGKTDPRWRDSKSSFKPKVSLDFRPGDSWIGRWLGQDPLLYLSWQQAIKGSSFNVVNLTDEPDFVKAEELEAYEVGLKTSLFDGLVSFNAAAFDYDLKNPQIQFVSLLRGGVVSFENAGSASVKGFEFDTTAQLFPSLTDGLVLTLSAVWLDPKYGTYTNGTGFDPNTGVIAQNLDFSGNQIVRSPKFSGTVGLSQTFTTGIGPIEIGADLFHTAKTFFLAQNSDISKQPAYEVIGARISYLYEPWNLRLTAFGKNIGNERYSNSYVVTDFGRNEARAQLSTYGVRLNWDF